MTRAHELEYASAHSRRPKRPLGRRLWSIIIMMVIVGFALLVAPGNVPRDSESIVAGTLQEVAVLKPALVTMLWFGLALGACLMLAASVVLLNRRRSLLGTLLLIGTLLATLFSLASSIVSSLAPWIIYDSLRAPDGSEYCFMDSSFKQTTATF